MNVYGLINCLTDSLLLRLQTCLVMFRCLLGHSAQPFCRVRGRSGERSPWALRHSQFLPCTAPVLGHSDLRLLPSSATLVFGCFRPRSLWSSALALAAALALASGQFLRSATLVVGHFGPRSLYLFTSALNRSGAWPLLRLRRSATRAIGRLGAHLPQCSAFFGNQPGCCSVATTLALAYVQRIHSCVH